MLDVKDLDMAILMDMLAEQTVEYTRMLTDNYKGDKFNTCEITIALLQHEINARKKMRDHISELRAAIEERVGKSSS